jgi:hypothetical protein
MIEEKIEIYEALLTTFFKCGKEKLIKIFRLLRETRLIYGDDIFRKCIKELIEWDIDDCVKDAYYCVLTDIVGELVNLKDLDESSYYTLLHADYNDPKMRFTFRDFEDLPVSVDEISKVTQRVNEFLELLDYRIQL